MFEEALRQAPREELVEHIRLQRELIHRLHRRVLELESSLESVYTCSSDGGGATGVDGQSTAPYGQQRAVLSSNARHGPSPPIDQQSVHGAPPANVRTRPLTTLCEMPLGFSERWRTDNDEAVAVPEPRRQPPRPHVNEKAPVSFARLSSLQQQTAECAAMATSANGTDSAPAPFSAAAVSTGLTSSSVDHPTVLEGIKEINYVLAAHRAGRTALPLPVVEELEDIRTRLLQGFTQTHSMGDRDDGAAHEAAAAARQAYGALPRSEEMVLNAGPSNLLFERRADTFRDATHVCPRWVSPDSSRVVYGTSPRRYQ
ncbi:conserved hypothetical protein [Leishmania mexicana MHOM/GT/2001/U1103]|uniref:Uncharacterized protein n=1 Tax=Leishmania mexicana (strain MHOM/GT/2001/U1103) TaxID=929439 RepID=E9AUH4_LEIMU|nr:conserved hypothetical protein [Leishmania mexicana MHOM/GT/2001/U1103]CBZ26602.1 conserved hypothetical protein [Leishmania mexicana MHOM/GT/2001/U1103]